MHGLPAECLVENHFKEQVDANAPAAERCRLVIALASAICRICLASTGCRGSSTRWLDRICHWWGLHEMDVLGSCLSDPAAAADMVLIIRNNSATPQRRDRHALARKRSI